MNKIDEHIAESFEAYKEEYDLAEATPREIYEAGFREGVELVEAGDPTD